MHNKYIIIHFSHLLVFSTPKGSQNTSNSSKYQAAFGRKVSDNIQFNSILHLLNEILNLTALTPREFQEK